MRRIIILFFVFILFLPVCLGFYIDVPETVSIERILAGSYAEEFVEITGDYELSSEIRLSSAGIAGDWIGFVPETFYLGEGETSSFMMVVRPPENITKGIYEGYVIIDAVPASINQITSAMSSSKDIKVIIEITDEEIKQVHVDYVDVYDISMNDPIEFDVSAENLGNIGMNLFINALILDSGKTVIISRNSTIELPSLSKRTSVVSVPHSLDIGSYFARILVSSNDCLVMEQLSPFDVLESIAEETSMQTEDDGLAGGTIMAITPVTLGANVIVLVTWGLIILFVVWRVARSKRKKKAGKKCRSKK